MPADAFWATCGNLPRSLLLPQLVAAAQDDADRIRLSAAAAQSERLRRLANRAKAQDEEPAHFGPGICDDFLPLYTYAGRQTLSFTRRKRLEEACLVLTPLDADANSF